MTILCAEGGSPVAMDIDPQVRKPRMSLGWRVRVPVTLVRSTQCLGHESKYRVTVPYLKIDGFDIRILL